MKKRRIRPIQESDRVVHEYFYPSLNALADAAQTTPFAVSHHDSDWSGGGWREALKHARYGWPEGAEMARKHIDKFRLPPIEAPYANTYNDVTGAYVDIGLYVSGEPECMVDFREDKRHARYATIHVSVSASAGTIPEKLVNRGLAIAATVDILESRGIRCEVIAYDPCYGSDDKGRVISNAGVMVKHANAPLNLDTLTFAVANPGFLRHLLFAHMELQSDEYRRSFNVPGGYGGVAPLIVAPGVIAFDTPQYWENWENIEYAIERAHNAVNSFIASDANPASLA